MEKVFADDYSGGIAGAFAGFFGRHSTGSLFRNIKIKEQGDEKSDSKLDLRDRGRIRIASGCDCCPVLRKPFGRFGQYDNCRLCCDVGLSQRYFSGIPSK
jgi:hypothetical protein